MPRRWNLSFVWLALVVAWPVAGCVSPADGGTPDWPSVQPDGSLVLVSGGYGYELADVVLVDAQRTPEPGDIVQYDDRLNDSDCYSFGPGQYLAKVIALPGESVAFQECSFSAGGFTGTMDCGLELWPRTQGVYWGAEWLEDIAGGTLLVPEGELLADRWIGQECRQFGAGSRVGSRFTIKSDAVIGVVLKKLGHDDRMQEYLESIVY